MVFELLCRILLEAEIPAGRGNSYLARIYPKSANPPGQIGLRQKFLPQLLLGIAGNQSSIEIETNRTSI